MVKHMVKWPRWLTTEYVLPLLLCFRAYRDCKLFSCFLEKIVVEAVANFENSYYSY